MRLFLTPGRRSLLIALAVCVSFGALGPADASPFNRSSPLQSSGTSPQAAALRIVVLEGEDSVNLIDKKTAVKPTVEVRDRNDLPVSGAAVRFAINGRNAAFQGGSRAVSVTTDSLGRATVQGLTPTAKGAVQIEVQASYQGQSATATITQTNFANAAEAAQAGRTVSQGSGSSGGSSAGTSTATSGGAAAGGGLSTAAIVGIAAGGAAAGIGTAVAVSGSSDSGSSTSTPSNPSPAPLNLTGTWNGAVTGSQSTGAVTWRLTQNGNSVTGTDVTPNPALDSALAGLPASLGPTQTNTITGSVNGSTVTLTAVYSTTVTTPSAPGVPSLSGACTSTVNLSLSAASTSSLSGPYTSTTACTGTLFTLAPPPVPTTDTGRVIFTRQ